MKIQWSILLLLGLSLVLLPGIFCEEQEYPCPNRTQHRLQYDLQVAPVVPDQYYYFTGDTIWLSADFPAVLTSTNTNEPFELDSAQIQLSLYLASFDWEEREGTGGYPDFDIVEREGRLLPTEADPASQPFLSEVHFTCGLDHCSFEIGFVPRERGFFVFKTGLSNALRPQDQGVECPPYLLFTRGAFSNAVNNGLIADTTNTSVVDYTIFNGNRETIFLRDETAFAFEVR